MKMLKYIHIALLLCLVAFTTSCEKYFDDVNVDPNRPSDVPPSVLLPSAQAFYAYGVGGDVSRFTSLFLGQLSGIDRQFATYQIYSVTETDTDNWWKFNHYGGAMFDLHDIIERAEAGDMPQYAGAAKILMAYGLMVATDMLGDVPYDEAFQGTDNLTPAYNTQEECYAIIQTLLTDGKADLAETGDGAVPGTDDFIYGGDATRWTMLANVLSARAHLHLGKRTNDYAAVLTALGTEGVQSFGSSADDAIFRFGLDETQAAPYYQFNDQRGDIGYTGFLHDTMAAMNDPRAAAYSDGAGGLGAFFNAPDAPFYFASYMEQKFIEAEA
ncbi:MAG TPA: SusD/RagB family nutrient-binding outer membrane lipoprotein, partial [Bacteroidia bacterium]|nr:SusD/RagB family nutrient-binding outer membrane lipoprotein [Bacteroidia bacterium]